MQRIRRRTDQQSVTTGSAAQPGSAALRNEAETPESETAGDHKAICSQIIYDGFIHYNIHFHQITLRARKRFEERDWSGHQQDIAERIDLYEESVQRVVRQLRDIMGSERDNVQLWSAVRTYFGERLVKLPDAGFIRTFFNSIARRLFGIVGTDPKLEFLPSGSDLDRHEIASLNIRRYPYWDSVRLIFETILEDFAFRVPWSDVAGNARYIADAIKRHFHIKHSTHAGFVRFEFIDSFFYQAARAYLVGRIIMSDGIRPLVVACKNEGSGISVDAVLLSENQISIVFGYTRSYYFADPNTVIGAVHFLHSLLVNKPLDELYTVLGRVRQGKTERHRIFTEHIRNTDDKFVHAAGDKGLVMIVFTLPSYKLVFKVIRDRFGYPKTITREQVMEKYRLVSQHDRAGRLIDTQEFRNLEFPVARFGEELLQDLLQESAGTVRLSGNRLIFRSVYMERRVRPLNLFIQEASEEDAQSAIIDYGQAIRDLAHTNIFPGDLLLKNFGVTQHKRVVFYDYDEVSLVMECNFRAIPESAAPEDEMRSQNWFYVNDNDVFPEEFIRFLSMRDELRRVFLKYHGELLEPGYWRAIREQHLQGTAPLVVPYESPALAIVTP